jgi:hypothetical protein
VGPPKSTTWEWPPDDQSWRREIEDVLKAIRGEAAVGASIHDAIAADPRSTIGAVVDTYLSLAHRDNIAYGCAVTALANDVARSTDRARSAYSLQVDRYVALIMSLIEHIPRKNGALPHLRRWPRSSALYPWHEPSTTTNCRGRS